MFEHLRFMRFILLIVCSLSLAVDTFSQTCQLQKWPWRPVENSSATFVDSLYNEIKGDSSKRYHILLYPHSGLTNAMTGLYVSFDSIQLSLGPLSRTSFTKKSKLEHTADLNYAAIEILNDYCGYYLGECLSETTDQTSTMVLANGKLKLWIEIDTLEGEISKVMDADPRFKELNRLIKGLSKF
jgi:hypothetical protein